MALALWHLNEFKRKAKLPQRDTEEEWNRRKLQAIGLVQSSVDPMIWSVFKVNKTKTLKELMEILKARYAPEQGTRTGTLLRAWLALRMEEEVRH